MNGILPSATNCDSGQALITQMDGIYQSAPADIQGQFQAAHDVIMSQYNADWYTGINYIPFNPQCYAIQDLGTQALALSNKMLVAMGQLPLTDPNAIDWTSIAVIAVVVVVGFMFVEKHL